jgi:RNA polymerase sigma-B factor
MSTVTSPRPHSDAGAELPRLFHSWQHDGDEAAREELIERFTPLTRSLARRYSRSSEPFEDLLQVATVGLLKAIDRFDLDRGHSFQSFAVPTVLGEMRRYFRDCGWSLHVPRGGQERALKLRVAHDTLTDEKGSAPTIEQLAEYMACTSEQVLDAMQVLNAYDTVSLDAPRPGADDDASFAESIGEADARFELIELDISVADALRQMLPSERTLLRMRFVENLTQTQIAERVGVSQMQVSRLLRRALEQVRALADPPDAGEAEPREHAQDRAAA